MCLIGGKQSKSQFKKRKSGEKLCFYTSYFYISFYISYTFIKFVININHKNLRNRRFEVYKVKQINTGTCNCDFEKLFEGNSAYQIGHKHELSD